MARTKQKKQDSFEEELLKIIHNPSYGRKRVHLTRKKIPRKKARTPPIKTRFVKKKRFKSGTGSFTFYLTFEIVALREIRKLQRSCKLLIPKRSFSRVVREIAQKIRPTSTIRFTARFV